MEGSRGLAEGEGAFEDLGHKWRPSPSSFRKFTLGCRENGWGGARRPSERERVLAS